MASAASAASDASPESAGDMAAAASDASPESAGDMAASASDAGPQSEGTASEPEGAPVRVHIYDLSERVMAANDVMKSFGTGAFHAGVEVHGDEWSFGFAEEGSGVRPCAPRKNDKYVYRQSVDMGHTEMSRDQVSSLLDELLEEWPGSGYSVLHRNCCHFSSELCRRLGVGPLPGWVMSAAGVGALLDDVVHVRSMVEQASGILVEGRRSRGAETDEYHFGDFSRGVASVATRFVQGVLAEGREARAAETEDYHFGDFCRGVASATAKRVSGLAAEGRAARDAVEGDGYRFSDIPRGAIAYMGHS